MTRLRPTRLGWAALTALAVLGIVIAWLQPGNPLTFALAGPLILTLAIHADTQPTHLEDTDQ